MSNGTLLRFGKFTADGNAKKITLRSDFDYFEVENETTIKAAGAGTGVEFSWQRGMADDTGFERQKLNADASTTKVFMATGGFTRIDTSENPLSAINVTGTAITNATPPVAECASTAGVSAGDTVRLVNTVGAAQFGGVDFTLGTVNVNTDMELVYGPTIIAGTTFSFFKVKWDPIFYPRSRFISSISQAANAVIVLTVTHGYTVGQKIKIDVPSDYGMTQIDGLTGTITALNPGAVANSIAVDIDSSTFTAFAWPLTAGVPFTHAKIVPAGEGVAQTAAGTFEGSVVNRAEIAMVLAAGTDSPAGVANDVIYWRAYKALDVDNT